MSKSLLLLVDGYNVIGPVAAPGRHARDAHATGVGSGSGNVRHWLQHERITLLDRLAAGLPKSVLERSCVVFDAANPPPNRPESFRHHGIHVRFAVGYPEADDLLEEIIAGHHSAKQLSVVTSDRRIQSAANRRDATWFESDVWLDELLDGRARLAHWPRGARTNVNRSVGPQSTEMSSLDSGLGLPSEAFEKPDSDSLNQKDVRDWMNEFGLDP